MARKLAAPLFTSRISGQNRAAYSPDFTVSNTVITSGGLKWDERAAPPPTLALWTFFLMQITFTTKCAMSKTIFRYFLCMAYIPRNYGFAPDGNRITLRIHKYVADGLGGEVSQRVQRQSPSWLLRSHGDASISRIK